MMKALRLVRLFLVRTLGNTVNFKKTLNIVYINLKVQLTLLTAIVKLFLKKPSETQELVQQVLSLATQVNVVFLKKAGLHQIDLFIHCCIV